VRKIGTPRRCTRPRWRRDRRGPVEGLAERVAHEGARRHVMAAHTYVDVADEFPTVGNGDASLQDA
jgi:hypothetical protein